MNDRDKDSLKTSTDIYTGHDTDYNDLYQLDNPEDSEVDTDDSQKDLPKKKKKRRKKHYMLRLVLFAAALIGIYFFLMSSVFSISEVSIKNNKLMESDVLINEIGIKSGDNIFKCTKHIVKKRLKNNPYIKDVKINRKLPDKFIITVYERIPTAAVAAEDVYVIMDDEGIVIDSADKPMSATVVTGINVKKYKNGDVPEFDNMAKFNNLMKLLRAANKSGLYFKKVLADGEDGDVIRAYVTDTMMCSGKYEDIIKSLEGIKAILYDLHQKGVQRGLIKIDDSGYAAFSPVID